MKKKLFIFVSILTSFLCVYSCNPKLKIQSENNKINSSKDFSTGEYKPESCPFCDVDYERCIESGELSWYCQAQYDNCVLEYCQIPDVNIKYAVTFYQHQDFKGWEEGFHERKYVKSLKRKKKYRPMQNEISSFKVRKGFTLVAYTQRYYSRNDAWGIFVGPKKMSNLHDIGFNDKISSFQVFKNDQIRLIGNTDFIIIYQ